MTCRETFHSVEEQRSHFKLDWHRLNVKRAISGLPPLPELECDRVLNSDDISVSASGEYLPINVYNQET
jgi:hypothetical protein